VEKDLSFLIRATAADLISAEAINLILKEREILRNENLCLLLSFLNYKSQ